MCVLLINAHSFHGLPHLSIIGLFPYSVVINNDILQHNCGKRRGRLQKDTAVCEMNNRFIGL